MKCLWLNHLPWWIPWWLENPHASSWKEGDQSGLLVFCPNTSTGEWVFLLLLCNYNLVPGEIEKVVSLFNSLWTSSSTVLFSLYDCHIIWNAPHIVSDWTDHENVLSRAKTWPSPKGSFAVYPLMTLPFVFVILCITCKSIEGHWCPRKAGAPSAFSQSLSLFLWFSGGCINTQVIERFENILWVLLHLPMVKERAFPWTVVLGTH